MSIVNEKPQLDLVTAHPRASGQEIEQKDRQNDALKIYSCFKEFETANFETLNPETEFSIQPETYFTSSNASTLSGSIIKAEESGLTFLQIAETGHLNISPPTKSYSVLTGRAAEPGSCPRASKNGN